MIDPRVCTEVGDNSVGKEVDDGAFGAGPETGVGIGSLVKERTVFGEVGGCAVSDFLERGTGARDRC